MHARLVELEMKPWPSADELRANSELKSSEYSVPVLGLIFLRYADVKFAKPVAEVKIPVSDLIPQGETTTIELKSTLRTNLHTSEKDPRMETSVLKTIAAFLNSHGGTLVIGLADDGSPVGIEADKFENEDKMYLHLVNLINGRIGPQHMMFVQPRFDDHDGTRVLVVECKKGKSQVYVKDGNTEKFFVRTWASITELSVSQVQEYIKQQFLKIQQK